MPNIENSSFYNSQNQSTQTQADDDIFYTYNYGGINVESSPVNIPLTDTPAMVNLDITLAGRLKKRGGSILRGYDTSYPTSLLVPVKLITGEYTIWEKVGTDIVGYLLPNYPDENRAVRLWNLEDVFGSAAANQKASWVLTSEEYPRIVILHKSNVPVEIKFYTRESVGNGTNTYTFYGNVTADYSTTRTFAIYDFNYTLLTSCTYDAGTGLTTFVFATSIPSGQNFTIFNPTWGWWAEAIKRTGSQCYDSNLRFNTSISADANVEVPTEIRRGLYADYLSLGLTTGQMPTLLVGSSSTTPTGFTWAITPASNTEYAWSNLQYTGGATETITPGTTYVTFGGIVGPGTSAPTPVHFIRINYFPFNGGTGVQGQYIYVNNSNGTTWTWRNTTASRSSYTAEYWVTNGLTPYASTSPTQVVNGIRFDASAPFGLTNTEFVEVTNKLPPSSYSGANCTQIYARGSALGGFVPIYGISEYANYLTGAFPTIISLYQNRVCLAGFPSAPLTVLMSNIKDYESRFYYQNFQIYMEDTAYSENPVEFVINGGVNEKITGMVDWFNSLFVFTENSVNRIYGGESIAVTPTNKYLSNVATIGCKSFNNIVKTDRNVIFISDSGLYKVDVLPEVGDYYVVSVSLKVKRFFNKAKFLLQNSWLAFNQADRLVYVGVSDGYDVSICQRLFVFNVEREAWSEYTLFNGYMPTCVGTSFDGRVVFLIVDRDTSPNALTSSSCILYLTEFNWYRPVDFIQYVTGTPATYTVLGSPSAKLSLTINGAQRIISLNKETQNSNQSFKLIPIDNFFQTEVTYTQGSTITDLTGGEDYIYETARDSIHFNVYPWNTSDSCSISLLDDSGNYPVSFYKNNVEQVQDVDYSVSDVDDYTITFLDVLSADDLIYTGFKYPCYHITPTFFRANPGREKRVTHFIGYYSNEDYFYLYQASEANTAASQDASEIADQYRVKANVNVAFLYNDTRTGATSTDLYLGSQLSWDVSLFDVGHSPFQQHEVVRIVEPIIGIGYSFKVCNFSFDNNAFELIGYQVETTVKGRNSRAWF